MFKEAKEFYQTFTFLNLTDIASLVKITRLKRFKAGDVLVNAGDINYDFFIVLKGALRNHVIRTDGEERTVFFAIDGEVTGSPEAMIHDKHTNETITALEDTMVASVNGRVLNELVDKNHRIQRLYMEMLKRNFVEAVGRIGFYTVMTAEERYLHILDTRSELIRRIPQKYLASYIGITPVSLSRIRGRLGALKKDG